MKTHRIAVAIAVLSFVSSIFPVWAYAVDSGQQRGGQDRTCQFSLDLMVCDFLERFEPDYYRSMDDEAKEEVASMPISGMSSSRLDADGMLGGRLGFGIESGRRSDGAVAVQCMTTLGVFLDDGMRTHARVVILEDDTGRIVYSEGFDCTGYLEKVNTDVFWSDSDKFVAVCFGYVGSLSGEVGFPLFRLERFEVTRDLT